MLELEDVIACVMQQVQVTSPRKQLGDLDRRRSTKE